MVVLCGVTVMFLAGLPWWLFAAPAAAVAVAAPIVYGMMHGYQRKRIDVFLDPESDPLGAGYHIAQSKIAIGSGGIWGKGFLHGSQSHLQYLPEGHTDFVFATMAEEWGLVGGVLLIFAFAAVIRWGMRVSQNGRTRFAQLAAAGLSATIFFYVAINLMMVMGLAPVVGVPLPLVSFGGSAVMTVMLCLGLLMALERQQRTVSRLDLASGGRKLRPRGAVECPPPRLERVQRAGNHGEAAQIIGRRRAVGAVHRLRQIVEPFGNGGQRRRRRRFRRSARLRRPARRAASVRASAACLALQLGEARLRSSACSSIARTRTRACSICLARRNSASKSAWLTLTRGSATIVSGCRKLRPAGGQLDRIAPGGAHTPSGVSSSLRPTGLA